MVQAAAISANLKTSAALRIARQFDDWAPSYETGRLAGWYQWQGALALDHLRLPEGGNILDIGCATGWALRRLAKQRPDMTGLGIDISATMISAAQAAARDEGLRNLSFRQFDWEDSQPLAGDRFDAILCTSVFHYFAKPLQALRRMRAALRPGGSLFLIERAMDGSLLTRAWDITHRTLIRDHVSFASSSTLMALAKDAGFEEVSTLARVNRMFWKNKLNTSLVLIEAKAAEER